MLHLQKLRNPSSEVQAMLSALTVNTVGRHLGFKFKTSFFNQILIVYSSKQWTLLKSSFTGIYQFTINSTFKFIPNVKARRDSDKEQNSL